MQLDLKTTLAISCLMLCGCDSMPTIKEICENSPNMCNDLNTDSWCRVERSEIIENRYLSTRKQTDEQKYKLLMAFEDYSTCIEKASKIEHIKLKEKKTTRVKGYLTSVREIRRLSYETRGSNMPELLYYHWSRHGNKNSLRKFLAFEDTEKLETPKMQYALATYYVKIDTDKTINILYHALELYRPGEDIDVEIMKTLSSLFMDEEKHKQAYVWAKVAEDFGAEDIDLTPLQTRMINDGLDVAKLDNLAANTLTKIQEGQFVAPLR